MTDKFIIGVVGAPFGVKGFVRVRSFSGEIEHLLSLKSVTINKDGNEKRLDIEESTPANTASTVLMRFKGIDSPEAAKTLNSTQLLAGRDEAAPLNKGEFYIEDLKGLQVFAKSLTQGTQGEVEPSVRGDTGKNKGEEFQIIGVITDIIEGGGGDLAEIKLISGEKRLVPFRKEFFSEINPAKSRVVLQNLWILE